MDKINIVDDHYDELDIDIDKVKAKPTMYISNIGDKGVEHLAHEMLDNITDEHKNENSISDGTASIFYDAAENIMSFSDTGRGIPFDMLETACTILHSGSKMNRNYGKTAGENGVGLTVTNALSELFEITSTRNGEAKFLQFKEGVKVRDELIKVKDKSKHGLLVSFKPSPVFMGKDARLPVESYMKWLQEQSFMFPEDFSVTFTCAGLPGMTAEIKNVYKNNRGIVGYLDYKYPNATLLSKPIVIHKDMTVVEEDVPVRQEDGAFVIQNMDRTIAIHVAFNFNPKQGEPSLSSFCNNIGTVDGGRHEDAMKNSIASFFLKKTNETRKKGTKKEYVLSDVMAGLSGVINLETTVSTEFESQTKRRLGNEYFYKPIKTMITSALEEMFKMPENKGLLNKIISYVKFNGDLRIEQSNKRSKLSTSAPSFMDSKIITGYIPPNLIHRCYEEGIYLEIYVVEGDSPGGQARMARWSNDLQGVLKLRGKPDKVWGYPISKLDDPKNSIGKFLNEVLGCGYGKRFSIEKCRYKRIIISSDADIDGDHIATLFVADLYRAAPELIEQGYVYRVIYPLYKLVDAHKRKKGEGVDKSLFLYDKNDVYKRFEDIVCSNIRLKFNGSDQKYIGPSNIKNFMRANREYYEFINDMSQYTVHPEIIEFIAANPDFKDRIKELDSELTYEEVNGIGEIVGDYKKESCSLVLDEITMSKIKYLSNVINIANDGITHYELYEKNNSGFEHIGRCSIYQIMNFCQKYTPDLDARFKGLGELELDELRELAMNPKNRVLARFTISDVEKLIATLDDVFLDARRNRRKEIIMESNISLDEIDN